tara:strand:- start:306 stop:686 length:381 start_codon:yes stop_codon:yes gene_type:complete
MLRFCFFCRPRFDFRFGFATPGQLVSFRYGGVGKTLLTILDERKIVLKINYTNSRVFFLKSILHEKFKYAGLLIMVFFRSFDVLTTGMVMSEIQKYCDDRAIFFKKAFPESVKKPKSLLMHFMYSS